MLCLARRLTILLGILGAAGCAISEKQEIAMGQQAQPQIEQEMGGLYDDPQMQQYFNRVGQSVVTYAGRQQLPWEFRIVESEMVNAFALPGGFVYMTTGLLRRLETEAQMAAILAHEIAHVTERHSVRQIEKTQWAQGGAIAAGIFGGGDVAQLAGVAANLALTGYSRDQEKDADLTGLTFLARAGYNPEAMVEAMQIISEADTGRNRPPEFLSTHPNPENRLRYLQREIERRFPEEASTGVVGAEEYRRQVLNRLGAAEISSTSFGG